MQQTSFEHYLEAAQNQSTYNENADVEPKLKNGTKLLIAGKEYIVTKTEQNRGDEGKSGLRFYLKSDEADPKWITYGWVIEALAKKKIRIIK